MAQDDQEEGKLPLLTAGARLREARLAAGLELEEIAARTRIARRHLLALEEDRYGDLASRAYAIGFGRTYARALKLDEQSIVASVRSELERQEELNPRPQHAETFEPGDPARVPSAALAWMGVLAAVVLFALLYLFWRSFLDPAGALPDRAEQPAASAASPKATGSVQVPASRVAGPVRLTALEDGVWLKIGNAAGEQIFQKEMGLNESFTVPADAQGPVLSTARPDALRVTVGTSVIAKLRDRPEILRNFPLTQASLLAPAMAPPLPPATGAGGQTSTVSDR
jgi:cytoskeleton protein RodZ